MYEPNGWILGPGLILILVGFVRAILGSAEDRIKVALTSISMMFFGLALAVYPLWVTPYLHLKTVMGAIPTWVLIVVGVWLYGNLGYRFAEYKLRVAKRWRTTHPIWLHILWPYLIKFDMTDDLNKSTLNWGVPTEAYYRFGSTIFLAPLLIINTLLIIILWLLWLGTMGRLKPIHREIWAECRRTKTP